MRDDVLRVVVGVVVFGGISWWIIRRTKDPEPSPLHGERNRLGFFFTYLFFAGFLAAAFFRTICTLVLDIDIGTDGAVAAGWLFAAGVWTGLRYPAEFLRGSDD